MRCLLKGRLLGNYLPEEISLQHRAARKLRICASRSIWRRQIRGAMNWYDFLLRNRRRSIGKIGRARRLGRRVDGDCTRYRLPLGIALDGGSHCSVGCLGRRMWCRTIPGLALFGFS